MTHFIIQPPPVPSLAVAGSSARFPLARVFCIGRNYRWQADEPAPTGPPSWFMKPASAVLDAHEPVHYPPQTRDFCHEVEWVVALSAGGRDLPAQEVEARCIWGYGVGLDLTRRDLQQEAKRQGQPWEPAKAFDQSALCAPLVPAAQCGHPKQGAIWLEVNGRQRQQADLADLLFGVPELVALLSRSVRLQAGDLIFTGTPAGVGPLQVGDTLSAGIEGLGAFSSTVLAPTKE
ncbi:MAG: FAA hydrolase family protein [Curvibacter sp.]|nr:MAG: FAA hydrolase family protein [Curvibacter sp.]